MDEAKLSLEALRNFPPELWALITYYLPGEQLGRLKLVGAKWLWRKLSSMRAVERVKLGKDDLLFYRWPAFLNELPDVVSLVIENSQSSWWQNWRPKLQQVSKTVKELRVNRGRSDASNSVSFFTSADGSALSLLECVPLLEVLDLDLNWSAEHSWMSRNLPPNLTTLHFGFWDLKIPLPATLIHLYAVLMNAKSDSPLVPFPSNLSTLNCVNMLNRDLLLPLLPQSLSSLITMPNITKNFTLEEIRLLPQMITQLEIYLGRSTLDHLIASPHHILALPKYLVHLETDSLPSECWVFLPTTLKTLHIDSIPSSSANFAVTIKNPLDSTVHEISVLPIHNLPRSITCLVLGSDHIVINPHEVLNFIHLHESLYSSVSSVFISSNATSTFPAQILDSSQISSHSLSSTPSTSALPSTSSLLSPLYSLFPPHLTSLSLSKSQLSPEAAKSLPASLTLLEVANLDAPICQHLPRSLMSLKAHRVLISREVIKFLPKSLTTLHLAYVAAHFPWIDHHSGNRVIVQHVMDVGSFHGELPWENEYSLPPRLTHFSLYNRQYAGPALNDGFAQNQSMKYMTYLDLRDSQNITDLAVPHLPAHLTHLNLYSASSITGKSFRHLPRHLTHLNLTSSATIFDDDVPHLPSPLVTLHIHCAIHLTNASAKYFPSSLKTLGLSKNSIITEDAFQDLPRSLRTSGSHFKTTNWSVVDGKIPGTMF